MSDSSIGSTIGGGIGTAVGGPIGGLIGSGLGGLVGGFFGGNSKNDPTNIAIDTAKTNSINRSLEGRADVLKGASTAQPSIDYLTKLLSGNSESIGEATAPTNATILSQYDTARRAVGSLPGRGGGKGQAIAQSYFQQAGAMTAATETARSSAAQQLASLGIDISKLGISEEEIGQSGLLDIIKAIQSNKGLNQQSGQQLGSGIGKLILSGINGSGGKDSSGSGGGTVFSNGGNPEGV